MFSQEAKRSEDINKNTVYLEAFGQGFAWSANYDRLFNTEKTFMNSLTVGLVFVPQSIDFGDGTYVGTPVSFNWLLGKKSHHLELGIGVTPMYVQSRYASKSQMLYVYASPKIGYRYQRPSGGMFFKATATALVDLFHFERYNFAQSRINNFSTMDDVLGLGYPVFPWPGLSVGYTFK